MSATSYLYETDTTLSPIALKDLKLKLFADGADKQAMLDLAGDPLIQGFTTNPTLMRRAGVVDYEAFAKDVLSVIRDRPISFEVLSDDFQEMYRQALRIVAWGDNVYVKIPVTNTLGASAGDLVRQLVRDNVKVNVTAVKTISQIREMTESLAGGPPSYISVFAGRIADTGRDPVPTMVAALEIIRSHRNIELIWASPRELFNIVQADSIGCHIITVTPELLRKLPQALGRDLNEFSVETVRMFYRDAQASGYQL